VKNEAKSQNRTLQGSARGGHVEETRDGDWNTHQADGRFQRRREFAWSVGGCGFHVIKKLKVETNPKMSARSSPVDENVCNSSAVVRAKET